MNAIIFGGSGFVGSHVADALSEAGHQVRIFDMKPSPYLRPDQEMIVGDMLDAASVSVAMAGCDVVLNFAGIADLDHATTQPVDTVSQNILGNAIILQGCVENRVKRVIYASTIYVYSKKGGFYRCSKQAAETYIEEFNRVYGLPYTVLRFGTLYGPRADRRNSIYRYLHQALTKGAIVTGGTGDERREYIHVRDAAQLVLETLDEKYVNSHITLTGIHSLQFKDLLSTIREIFDNKVEIVYTNDHNEAHYDITPYSYAPRVGRKLAMNYYTDLGQGLLECLEELGNTAEHCTLDVVAAAPQTAADFAPEVPRSASARAVS